MENWKKLSEESMRLWFRKLTRKTFLLPNGKTDAYDISGWTNSRAVCCLALTEDNQVILCRQYRPGPEKILLEMPGGWVEANELPIDAMNRELLEETGHVWDIEFVGTTLDDAYSSMLRYNFVVKNCKKIQEPLFDQDHYEYGETVFMSVEDFRKHIRSWELTDVETGYLCLDYLNLL